MGKFNALAAFLVAVLLAACDASVTTGNIPAVSAGSGNGDYYRDDSRGLLDGEGDAVPLPGNLYVEREPVDQSPEAPPLAVVEIRPDTVAIPAAALPGRPSTEAGAEQPPMM